MALTAGTKLGPYEILSPLGAGGMGEVYRARDARLDRIVALKILPAAFANDPDGLRRFEQEARLLSALNHPNILVIYDVGTNDGTPYLVSEFLEGQTLRQRLSEGAMSVRKASECGLQIARGLAAAHDRGIIHRDIKPENILITPDGRVKLLDFGLAKEQEAALETASEAAIRTQVTEPGVVMGTVGYMSPEQVRGARADHRTDIFSFGAVLYEMVSGQRAFQGNSGVETMNAILKEEPPELSDSRVAISPGLERIIWRCLEKSPEQRFQSASDLAFAIGALSGTSSTSTAAQAVRPTPRRGWIGVAALLLLAGIAAGLAIGLALQRRPIPTFRQLVAGPGFISSGRFTPDGQSVIYGASWRGRPFELFTTRTDSIESRSLSLPPADLAGLSATGDMLVFLDWHNRFVWNMTGTLARVSLSGGAPRPLLEDVCGADIEPDGKEVAAVRCGGSQQTLESPMGKVIYRTHGWIDHVRFSPDGKDIAFLDHPISGDDRGYVAWVDAQAKVTRVTDDWPSLQGLAWTANGREIWFSGSQAGEPASVWAVDRAAHRRLVYSGPADLGLRDVGADGKVLLLQGRSTNDIAVRRPGGQTDRLVEFGSEGGRVTGISNNGSLMALSYFGSRAGTDYLTYVVNADTQAAIRIGDGDPRAISADGKWIFSIFPSSPGKVALYPTGAGETRIFTLGAIRVINSSGSSTSDSSQLVFAASDGERPPRGYLFEIATGKWRPITPEGTSSVLIAPNGKYVIAKSELNGFQLFPLSGGDPVAAKGISSSEEPVQWDAESSHLYIWDRRFPARITLVNPWTGERKLWLETQPPDPSGVLYGNFFITPDGKTYAYRFRRVLTTLFLAEGLR